MRGLALLAAGLLGLLLSNGRYTVGLAAWITPALLLAFLDRQRSWRGLALLSPGVLAAYLLMWRGFIPAPGWLYVAIAGGYGLASLLPYAVEASLPALARRSWPSTLVFPCAWVTTEWLLDRLTPYGSWISIAYTQVDLPVLRQGAALFGLATITFFVTWTGALLAWGAAQLAAGDPGRRRLRPGLLAWIVTAVALTAHGELRLRRSPGAVPSLRTALIPPDPQRKRVFESELGPVLRSGASSAPEALRAASAAVVEDLIASTRREAQAGARLVAWSETAAMLLQADLEAFTERLRVLASEEDLHLVVGVGVWNPQARPPLRNALLAFGPEGWLDWSLDKAHPVVGSESPFVAAGTGRLPDWDTPLGRITAAICHDLDFPGLIRQSSGLAAALLIGPADDWPDIDWWHADMARMRAVENGLTLLRPARGVSLVADPEGRILAARNSFVSGGGALVASVPVARRATLYGVVGASLSWACLVGLLLLWPWTRRGAARSGVSRKAYPG